MNIDDRKKASTPSPAKLEIERKYGEGATNEVKIRETKTDATLFYLINAIDKDVRTEACKEILKRALTDIYFGVNETELVKQEDIVNYINKMGAPAPTKQWLFTVEGNRDIKEPVLEPVSNNITLKDEEVKDNYDEEDVQHLPEIEAEVENDIDKNVTRESISSGMNSDSVIVDDFTDDSPF